MQLSDLFVNIPVLSAIPQQFLQSPVSQIARDSRQVAPGTLFFCIAGMTGDGHDYAAQALAQGAVAVVVERDLQLPRQILVEDTHLVYGLVCGNYYGNPAHKLKLLAVTGTNGKTTVTYITKGILEAAGITTGLIGTIENQIGHMTLQATHTTPDPYQLHALFARMVEAGCTHVVMEASSHALDQHRMAGLRFESAAFTNLSQDHLDYHGTMQRYFAAKASLFAMCRMAVLNGDDPYGRKLVQQSTVPVLEYSLHNMEQGLGGSGIAFSEQGSAFDIRYHGKTERVQFLQPGYFSVSNALCAAGLCLTAGVSWQQVVAGLQMITAIPGRFETLFQQANYSIIRDFAHSADGLEKLLSTIRELTDKRIITVFGCAGERDRTKRGAMAQAVAKYSDYIFMTADNPRSEPLQQIFADALPALQQAGIPYKVVESRFDAIKQALEELAEHGFLVLAGKGHEDYQVLDYGTVYFDEKQIVQRLLQYH